MSDSVGWSPEQEAKIISGFATLNEAMAQVMENLQLMGKALLDAIGPFCEWLTEISVEIRRQTSGEPYRRPKPRAQRSTRPVESGIVRVWRWSPMYGRR